MTERGMPWYKRYPADAIRGTAGQLTAREMAVYWLVIDLIYVGNGSTRNDARFLAGHIADMGSASVRKTLLSLAEKGKLTVSDEWIKNDRATIETENQQKTSKNRAVSGEKGGKISPKQNADVNEINDIEQAKNGHIDTDTELEADKKDPHTPKGGLSDQDIPDDQPLYIPEQTNDWPPKAFEKFYDLYPHKVAKQSAIKAFAKLRKSKDPPPFAELMAGLGRYIEAKPDWKQWLNPATFLNGGNWADVPATNNPKQSNGTANTERDNFESAFADVFGTDMRSPGRMGGDGFTLDGEIAEDITGSAGDGNSESRIRIVSG